MTVTSIYVQYTKRLAFIQNNFFFFFSFINFLKNYTSDTLDIAFSSERSIEDAIDKLSESETSTVIISYSTMFIYIALALGKIRGLKNMLVGKLVK